MGPPESATPTSGLDEWSAALVSGIDMTAVNVAAGTALGVAGIYDLGRAACSPAVSILFTNVRLLACVAMRRLSTRRRGEAARATSRAVAPTRRARRFVRLYRPSAGPFGDGFKDGANGDGRNLDLYSRSDWLLAKLGVALGAVYFAMFVVWIALTRARWNRGPRLRG